MFYIKSLLENQSCNKKVESHRKIKFLFSKFISFHFFFRWTKVISERQVLVPAERDLPNKMKQMIETNEKFKTAYIMIQIGELTESLLFYWIELILLKTETIIIDTVLVSRLTMVGLKTECRVNKDWIRLNNIVNVFFRQYCSWHLFQR